METTSFVARDCTIAILGSSAVGKTSLCLQFTRSSFSDKHYPTKEDHYSKAITLEGASFIVNVIDTGAEQDLDQLNSLIRLASGFILVYDITDARTFNEVQQTYRRIRKVKATQQSKGVYILVGNKLDLQAIRQVTESSAKQLAGKWGCQFIETSAKQRVNHEFCFQELVKRIVGRGQFISDKRCCALQ